LGGAEAILGAYLEEVLGRFGVNPRHIARRILQALVSARKTRELLSGAELARQLGMDWPQIEPIVADLENYRLLRKVEAEEGYKYELVHEHIVQQVWSWLSEQEARVKEVQELVDSETRLWPKYRTPISDQKLDAIYGCWKSLILDEIHLELLFRSSIALGRLREWNEVSDGLGQKLFPLYSRLLQDPDAKVVRLAALALAKQGDTEALERAVTQVEPSTQSYIRRALRQIEEQRSVEEVQAEVSSSAGWKERLLWNASSVVGIDFGTTTSAIAVSRNESPMIIPNKEGSKFTPSVVAFTDKGEIVVGTAAALQAATNPDRTVFSTKRQLGTDWTIRVGSTTYTAVDVASLIFKSLKQDAESYLEREVRQAVVAVPAYFSNTQRRALRSAAEAAGFEVVRMIAEPTAAAMAYGLGEQYDREIAVYDLGGGTFDISILGLGSSVFEVLAVNGNTTLGGDDFDDRIVGYLIDEFRKQHGIDLSVDRVAGVRLKEAAERAKIALSGLDTINIYVPYIYADANGIKHLDVDLDRATFEGLTRDLVKETIRCCELAVQDARVILDDAKRGRVNLWGVQTEFHLVLVGLSTKIPAIRQAVTALFGVEPRRGVDPDEAVALGAAIQGGVLGGVNRDTLLLDAIPLTLGLETLGGIATPIIERNTSIPSRKSQIFTTVADKQAAVRIHIVEGERPMAADNKSLGRFILDQIPPASRGVSQIEVTFDIDADGLLIVSAQDRATGRAVTRSVDFGVRNRDGAAPQQIPSMGGEMGAEPAGELGLAVSDSKKSE
jgi:molecular chaperone DnaK